MTQWAWNEHGHVMTEEPGINWIPGAGQDRHRAGVLAMVEATGSSG